MKSPFSEFRFLSGLSWQEMSELHLWLSGKEPDVDLLPLLGAIKYVDRGSASLNRKAILSYFHLLRERKYEEFKQAVGKGHHTRPVLGKLSEERYFPLFPVPR